MTALAVALVLCCAMLCGTVLAYQRVCTGSRMADAIAMAQEAMDEAQATRGTLRVELRRIDDVEHAQLALRTDVDSLKAQAAFRGM